MSQSPATVVDSNQAQGYITAFAALGHMVAEGRSFSGHERNCVFLNNAGGRFADISAVSGLDFDDDGRAVGVVDWDHDGDLDLWLRNRTSPQLRYMRNDSAGENHFLSVRLKGRTCNRDAIGARLEMHLKDPSTGEPVRIIKTLHAGQGFLSQSSKWVHFGLGSHDQVEKLLVRWPGGARETFTGLEVDRHYKIEQGSGSAQPWTRPRGLEPLKASALEGRPATVAGRIFLAAPPPLPTLAYEDLSGRKVVLNEEIEGPTLVNLWASWCVPCRGEFDRWKVDESLVRAAGLRIIALSVDGLDPSKQSGVEDARKFLKKMAFPFEAGLADSELLSKLQILSNVLFSRVVPLAVPTSFLIDSDGRLAAIYRGTVEIRTLLDDVDDLDASLLRRRSLGTPFRSNRWAVGAEPLPLEILATRLGEKGFLDDALVCLRQELLARPNNATLYGTIGRVQKHQGDTAGAVESLSKAVQLDPDSYELRMDLAEVLLTLEEHAQAVEQFNEMVRIAPGSVYPYSMLGRLLVGMDQLDLAIEHLGKAEKLDPENPEVQRLMGVLLNQKGDARAISYLSKSIRIRPDHPLTHLNLGDALAKVGKIDQAVEAFEKTLQLATTSGNARLAGIARQSLQKLRRQKESGGR